MLCWDTCGLAVLPLIQILLLIKVYVGASCYSLSARYRMVLVVLTCPQVLQACMLVVMFIFALCYACMLITHHTMILEGHLKFVVCSTLVLSTLTSGLCSMFYLSFSCQW